MPVENHGLFGTSVEKERGEGPRTETPKIYHEDNPQKGEPLHRREQSDGGSYEFYAGVPHEYP